MPNKPNFSLGCYNLIDKIKINSLIEDIVKDDLNFHTYATPKGFKNLRNNIASFLEKEWNYKINGDMIITTGSQQSINLLTEILNIKDSNIVIEQPTYFGALSNFKKARNLFPVYINEDGIDIEGLKELLTAEEVDYIYVVPTFNNPTGYSWTLENRLAFLEIVNKYNITVIEDDPYSLINYTDEEFPSLYKLNEGKNIIYLGTFSKYLSPAITVGYILGNKELIDKLYKAKENADLCTNALIQLGVSNYLERYNLKEDITKKIKTYKFWLQKSRVDLMAKYKTFIKRITKPKGGLFYLVYFDSRYDGSSTTNEFFLNSKEKVLRINICYDISKNQEYFKEGE